MHPDLAVEVLSASNTRAEMQRKRREYFESGTTLVWEIDPPARTLTAYTSPEEGIVHAEHDPVEGGEVLPGFTITLGELFEQAERRAGKRH